MTPSCPSNDMPPKRITYSVAHTPDTDDAFYFSALAHGTITPANSAIINFHTGHIAQLNRDALDGVYDITAISAAFFPRVFDSYRILTCGTSVGRGYGPRLAVAQGLEDDDLADRRVGIAAEGTTGAFLLKWYYPHAIPVECCHLEMRDLVAQGELDGAVLIHEQLLLTRPEHERISIKECLGARWCHDQNLPLPVGLNVIHKRIPLTQAKALCQDFQDSLQYGFDNPGETRERVGCWDHGAMDEFIQKFANQDSLALAPDVRQGLVTLLDQVAKIENRNTLRLPEIIDGHDCDPRSGAPAFGRSDGASKIWPTGPKTKE